MRSMYSDDLEKDLLRDEAASDIFKLAYWDFFLRRSIFCCLMSLNC
jgi:hypothetical protein